MVFLGHVKKEAVAWQFLEMQRVSNVSASSVQKYFRRAEEPLGFINR